MSVDRVIGPYSKVDLTKKSRDRALSRELETTNDDAPMYSVVDKTKKKKNPVESNGEVEMIDLAEKSKDHALSRERNTPMYSVVDKTGKNQVKSVEIGQERLTTVGTATPPLESQKLLLLKAMMG